MFSCLVIQFLDLASMGRHYPFVVFTGPKGALIAPSLRTSINELYRHKTLSLMIEKRKEVVITVWL